MKLWVLLILMLLCLIVISTIVWYESSMMPKCNTDLKLIPFTDSVNKFIPVTLGSGVKVYRYLRHDANFESIRDYLGFHHLGPELDTLSGSFAASETYHEVLVCEGGPDRDLKVVKVLPWCNNFTVTSDPGKKGTLVKPGYYAIFIRFFDGKHIVTESTITTTESKATIVRTPDEIEWKTGILEDFRIDVSHDLHHNEFLETIESTGAEVVPRSPYVKGWTIDYTGSEKLVGIFYENLDAKSWINSSVNTVDTLVPSGNGVKVMVYDFTGEEPHRLRFTQIVPGISPESNLNAPIGGVWAKGVSHFADQRI